MKKLIVSMMLIIGMFAFAAESDPSATVGYVKYGCVTTAGTNNNFIALPMDEGYTTASELDPSGTNMDAISSWNATSQAWESSNYNSFFGIWDPALPVATGNAYMINAVTAFDYISDGPLVADTQYNLVTTAGTNNNFIMHPLSMSAMATGGDLGDDIGSCDAVSSWDGASQAWVSTNYNSFFGIWDPALPSEIGKPLMVNVTGATTWPGAKAEYVEGDKPASTPKGVSKTVYHNVVDASNGVYDFSGAPYDNITFKAWITARPAEIQHETDTGAGYSTLGGASWGFVNVGNFTSDWTAGEIVRFVFKDEVNLLEGYGEYPLDASGSAIYAGFPAMGTGNPIQVDSPASIEGMIPEVTKLHQNYPNPFNPTTTIKFDLSSNTEVKLNVYNYNGQMVKSLVGGQMNAGYHTVNFDASNLSAGVYYYTLEADNKVMTNKMVLVK